MASATRVGLRGIDRAGSAVGHGAVRAGARADVAEDHERGGAVVPALADVRAARFLADGVQVQLAHQPLEPQVARRPRRAHLQPLGLRVSRGRATDRGMTRAMINYIGRESRGSALRPARPRAILRHAAVTGPRRTAATSACPRVFNAAELLRRPPRRRGPRRPRRDRVRRRARDLRRAAERVNRFGSALRDRAARSAGGTGRAAPARRPGVR